MTAHDSWNEALSGRLAGLRKIVKQCGVCRAAYSPAVWARLPLLGFIRDEVDVLELRNCTCGNTLAMVTQ